MIESTFWQAEETPELDQGLWDDLKLWLHYYEYCYCEYRYYAPIRERRTITFNYMLGIFTYDLPIKKLGLTEHD